MRKIILYFSLLAGLSILSSCANYKLNYSKTDANWEEQTPLPSSSPQHRMYLIGDAGNAPLGKTTNVLKYLKTQLAQESANSSIIFLGDNIYPGGMPPKGEAKDRIRAEYRLKAQMDILADFKGRPFFIPGNHDWRRWGLKGLKRQEKFIEEYLNKDIDDEDKWQNYFLPDDGCSGPEIIELNENLVLLIIDSQWWLADWDKEPEINDGCEAKNRFMLQFFVENALRKHRRKNVVIALHHPLYTNGPHGGNYTFKEHIFPLTEANENLYIPLPILGTAASFLRGAIGSKQDVAHQTYKDLKHALLLSAKKNGSFIFVSGHEHNLQYLENELQTFIVSGSGSKQSPSKIGNGAAFAYGGQKGYATIDFYGDGKAWVQFWVPDQEGLEAKLVFRKKLKDKTIPSEENIPDKFPIFEKGLDSIDIEISQTKAGQIGFIHKALLGTHHRKVYQQKYKLPVLDLSQFRGGMTPVKRGGGNQTNSLRLEDPQGKQFVMRAMTKDASRLLPFPFNKMTAAKFIAEDNFLSTHPFAPTALPHLADAANIYHTNPKFYFIPKQPALGVYNDEYGDDVYLVEERPNDDWEGTGVFGDSKKIIGTPDVTKKILKNHKHYIDQEWALRSRLFDIIIGDWDRHDDQWRWARFDRTDAKEDDKHRLYRPIPRDRDQAFSKYDGLLIKLVRLFIPFMRQLRVYDSNIENMKWITWSSRYFDHSFLNELDWEDWQKQVHFIQENLSDEVIETAFQHWPQSVQDLSANHIIQSLKDRRNNLETFAKKFYTRLSRRVDVVGTEKKEHFEITRTEEGKVRVLVWESDKHGKKRKHPFYNRTFINDVTKEIDIYGIGDDDVFHVTGVADESILLRLIGGQGKDVFIDESLLKNGPIKTFVYDDLRENKIEPSKAIKDKRSKHRELNLYDRKAAHYQHNFFYGLPILGANPDDGFTIGMSGLWTTYAFKKAPYATQHSFSANYAFATNAWGIDYSGDYLNVFGHWDFYLEAKIRGSSYAANFYGLGNETIIDNSINYYRTRQSQIHLFPAFKKRIAGGAGNIRFGPIFEMRDLEPTQNRFLISEFQPSLEDKLYKRKTFAGGKIHFDYINLDNYVAPKKGIHFSGNLAFLGGLNNDATDFGSIRSELAFYQSLDKGQNIVFASKIGFNTNIGNDFEFYHAPNLGGKTSLRGYRAERFYGKTAFWQNIDLRVHLFSSYNKTLPFTFGLYGGFDHGRIWEENDTSKLWHYNYGGGFWIAPVDALTFSFGVFQAREKEEEGPRFAFKLGMGF